MNKKEWKIEVIVKGAHWNLCRKILSYKRAVRFTYLKDYSVCIVFEVLRRLRAKVNGYHQKEYGKQHRSARNIYKST